MARILRFADLRVDGESPLGYKILIHVGDYIHNPVRLYFPKP